MAINVKLLLVNAMLSLSTEKPVQKITIADITQRSGTSRQTFYNHFMDKNDLICYIFLKTLKGERTIIENEGYYAYLVNLHKEAQKYSDFIKQACKITGQNSLRELLYKQNYKYYRNLIVEHYGEEALTDEIDYALQYNAYGDSNMYINWALAGMPGTPEKQASLVYSCFPDCIKEILPVNPKKSQL